MEIFIIVLIILLILNIISLIYSCNKVDISFYDVENSKIDKNLKIMFLSDLHNRNMTSKLDSIIKEENPDIIICGGDMVNEKLKETANFFKLLDVLDNYKTYYTFGNHEEYLEEDLDEYKKKLKKYNIILLNDKKTSISKNIILYGLESEMEMYQRFNKPMLSDDYIVNKLGKVNENKFNILLAHNPLEFKSYYKTNYDLVLSGHIHAGLIRIPFIGALFSPDYTLFPKYSEGKYKKNNTTMIVSRGLGFSKRIPLRINNPAEVVIINLKGE